MQFNSQEYFYFLVLAVTFWWLARQHRAFRLAGLFLFGCAFYMAWTPPFIVIMLGAAVLDYWAANQIAKSTDEKVRKAWLATSIVVNLSLLGTFKYWNFVLGSVRDGAGLLGHPIHVPLLHVALPVGISFYTFETMSYTLDVYRGHLKPAKSVVEFVMFITFFPKLVAGPIVRAADFLPQLEGTPRLRREQVSQGLFLIATGLVKKVAFADYLSVNLVDRVFGNPEFYTATEVVIGLYGFTLQIYCDFSGYTDVARGTAKLLGIDLAENFDRPYQARSVAEFWRRWHMTLSTWLRDYLYYPLGGSRVGGARAYFNLWLTMFLIGLWHGASWTFVLYGSIQGFAMVIHRYWQRRAKSEREDGFALVALKVFVTMQFVVFTRILFRASSFANALAVVSRLGSGTVSIAQISTGVWVALVVGFAFHYTPRAWFKRIERAFLDMPAPAQAFALAGAACGLTFVATSEVVPYIYQQF